MKHIVNLVLVFATLLILPGCCGKKCCKAKPKELVCAQKEVQVVVEPEPMEIEVSKNSKELAQ